MGNGEVFMDWNSMWDNIPFFMFAILCHSFFDVCFQCDPSGKSSAGIIRNTKDAELPLIVA